MNSKYLTFKYSTILSLEQIEKSLNKPLRQGRRMLFYGGVLSKDFGDHSRRQKSLKVIQNLIFGIIFLKVLISGIQHFYICPDVPVDIIRVFFQISLQKVSKPTKTDFTNLRKNGKISKLHGEQSNLQSPV